MIELCIEKGEATYEGFIEQRRNVERSSARLGDIMIGMGVSENLVEKLVYKDKLNYLLIWYLGIVCLVLLFLIIYSL
jgi:hypothetical protein